MGVGAVQVGYEVDVMTPQREVGEPHLMESLALDYQRHTYQNY